MTNLETYVEQMEKTNSSPCYVKTQTLRKLLNVVKAATVVNKKLSHGYHTTFPTADWMHLVDELRAYYEEEPNDAR